FLLMRGGMRYAPLLFLAPIGGDFAVRGLPTDAWLELAAALLLGASYTGLGALLVGPLRIGRELRDLRDVNCFVIPSVIAPLPIGIAYVALHIFFDPTLVVDPLNAVLQFWIGDAIGIVVTTPLLLEFVERPPVWRPRVNLEIC